MTKRVADPPWKQAERRLANAFGLVRNGGGSGRSAGRVGDTRKLSDSQCFSLGLPYPYGPNITFEAKWRGKQAKSGEAKRFYAWKLLDELRADLQGTVDMPAVALFEKGRPGFVVAIHSRDILTFANIIREWYCSTAKSAYRFSKAIGHETPEERNE
ncbi:MAG: hypothetical protein ACTSXE_02540 [Candidatus Thorarchaeota archaeon]